MKTHIALLSTLLASPLLLATAPAWSDCSPESGYVFVWDECVTEPHRSASSPCHRDGERNKRVYIISNVIWDGPDRTRDYPFKRFSQSYKRSTGGDRINGSESNCYRSREAAENDRESRISDRMSDGVTIYHVHISE